MADDLKIIKNKFGENMSNLCKELFPTILENPGLLSNIMLSHFYPNHFLFNDILANNLLNDFKDYIYSFIISKDEININEKRTPFEILKEKGYTLYECHTESDIQKFKKYFNKREELCTFRDNRLKKCYVFFAIKDNALELNRNDFINPQRQDEYGTSVISIQFTKDDSQTLSIKNRYNHSVSNPDSTFSNNLDNIAIGLTSAFYNTYGLKQNIISNNFEIDNYVYANDEKYYKYNYEINNVYYCPNNIIIDNFEVKKFPKEKYIIADYFIIDLVNKNIRLYDNKIQDSFLNDLVNIENIEVNNITSNKKIFIKTNNGQIKTIILDNKNQIIEYDNEYIKQIDNYFLSFNNAIKKINLPNVNSIPDYFLYYNNSLENININNVKYIGNYFLYNNIYLRSLNIPNVQSIGNYFMYYNESIINLDACNVQTIGNSFLLSNDSIKYLMLPSVLSIGNSFLYSNNSLISIDMPNIIIINDGFLYNNKVLINFNAENLQIIGDYFLTNNTTIENINLPNIKIIGENSSSCINRYRISR
ncbi:MAG: leucine-rich repeat protein [bacterium]|nr:leucine-rich repeat protein [bacterium]